MKLIKIYNSRSHTGMDLFHGRCSSNVFPWSYAFGNFAKLNHFNHYQLWLLSVSILFFPSVIPFFMSGTIGLALWEIWLKGKFSDYTFGLGLVGYLCVSQFFSHIVKLFLAFPGLIMTTVGTLTFTPPSYLESDQRCRASGRTVILTCCMLLEGCRLCRKKRKILNVKSRTSLWDIQYPDV